LVLKQRNLFKKFVGDRLVNSIAHIAASCNLFKFINEEDYLIEISRLFHQLAQIGANFLDSVHHQHAGHDFDVFPGQGAGQL